MHLTAFRASLAQDSPPPDLTQALRALWLDARGDWDGAMQIGVHPVAHAALIGLRGVVRKEGDAGNAAYWYRRACKPVCRSSLDEEWEAIASALLQAQGDAR